MERTDKNIVKKAVYKRPDNAHKGSTGSLLSICGSYGMAGASIMAGRSALRCGLGLLKCAVPKSIYSVVAGCMPESVFFPLCETEQGCLSYDNCAFLLAEAQNSSAVLLGCGLGVCEDTKNIVFSFIEKCTKPIVLDADALNCISESPEILLKKKASIIITPHPGEMSRLSGLDVKAINENRESVALEFASKYGVTAVLKGHRTVIATPQGRVWINTTGNSGMATGGSGDVLAGMTASMLAQGADANDVAPASVYLHGLAGDIACDKFGKISMLPSDITDCIHLAYKACGF